MTEETHRHHAFDIIPGIMRLHYFSFVFALTCLHAAPTPVVGDSLSDALAERGLPPTPPSMPDHNAWIFDRGVLGSIQGEAAEKPYINGMNMDRNRELFEDVHRQLIIAWKEQMEVRRYWDLVMQLNAMNLGVEQTGEWTKQDKYQWRSNCEWLIGVSRRLTSVYDLTVSALAIFPDATPHYCMLKL